MRILKKTGKIILWIVGSLLFLFIAVAVMIQIPAIQNFLIHKATVYVSTKTHTKVEIERIGITFPTAVFINGLFLEDKSQDTLLYAGKIKVDMSMFGLIKNNINLQSVALSDFTLNFPAP